jgi:Ca-activated chloride channel family protein
VQVDPEPAPALTTVWARDRLRDLEDRYVIDRSDELEKEIVATSLRFGVLCRFTAFVAVDRSEVVNPGGQVHGIVQPVEQPAGWEMGQTYLACALPHARNLGTSADEAADMLCDEEGISFGLSMPSAKLGAWPAPGLFESLGGMLRGKKKRQNAPEPQVPTASGAVGQQHMVDLVQRLQGTATDATSRLSALRAAVEDMEQVFSAMLGASNRSPEVLELAEVIAKIRALLAQARPDEAAVNEVWSRTETALQNLLVHLGGPAPAGREGFWK